MAPRPNWKGYLKLSLVSCPVALYPATSAAERVSFRQINKKTGNRLRQQLVDDVTREPVGAEDKGRGYEVDKNVYVPVEDEELDAIQVEATHTIEIDSFVPVADVDERYFDTPYYVVPNDKVGQDAFAVIREAMRGKNVAAIGRVVIAKRERPIMLSPDGKGLRGTTLRYPYEIRDEAEYFADIPDIKVPAEMLKLADHIVGTKLGTFDPTSFVDHYETALVELLKNKQAGIATAKPAPRAAREPAGNVIDLLRRSVELGKRQEGQEIAAAATGNAKKQGKVSPARMSA